MVTTNTQNKLPGSALGYLIIGRAIIGIILIIIGLLMIAAGTMHGTTTVNGVTTPVSFTATIPAIVVIIIGIIIPFWSILWYMTFSYIVADQNVTINSGVLFRQSKVIDFNKIQNVDNTRGPIQMMFGLTSVNIWTASEDQFVRSGRNTVMRPEGRLYLSIQDAEDLKGFMTTKGTVQNVHEV